MRAIVAFLIFLVLLVPTGVAPPPPQAQNGGLANACQQSGNEQPCSLARVVSDTTVGPGETQTYDEGEWTVEGTVHVEAGGTLVLDDVVWQFTAESGGILVDTGGILRIVESTLEPKEPGATYVLDLAPASQLLLNDSVVRGGHGVRLATADADVRGNSFEQIPLALHLLDVVELTISFNQFLDNDVAVNMTGGVTTLDQNYFQGGTTCVRNWLADPTITNNLFRGCHTGIWHERSHSYLAFNDMEDDALPPGTGIRVIDTNSPVIEGNIIRHYSTGIVVENATAYIRNNTIADNGGDGVRIESNTGPMDIQGNEIFDNLGDGIHLLTVDDVRVFGNDIHHNTEYGIRVDGASATTLDDNHVHANGIDGMGIVLAPGIVVTNNTVHDNTHTGIVVGVGSTGAVVDDNLVGDNGDSGIFVRASSTTLRNNTANNNADHGFAFVDVTGIILQRGEAGSNGENGFWFSGAAVNGSWLNATHNTRGMHFTGAVTAILADTNASENDAEGYLVQTTLGSSVDLVRPNALFNGGAGLRGTNGTSAGFGWWEGNAGAGVENLDQDWMLPAECSYWGSASGPTHDDNPSGTGDEAVGPVDFSPYRPAPAPSSCFAVVGVD